MRRSGTSASQDPPFRASSSCPILVIGTIAPRNSSVIVSRLGYRRVGVVTRYNRKPQLSSPILGSAGTSRQGYCLEPIHASEPPLRTRSLCNRRKIEFVDAPERTHLEFRINPIALGRKTGQVTFSILRDVLFGGSYNDPGRSASLSPLSFC
jgi:hypothetical protein